MTSRRVIIIGGGYAGVRLARELDKDSDVTLVDLKESFFHRIASLRASAHESWTYSPFIPYDALLAHGRVVFDKAIGIDTAQRQVALASGRQLLYDVLVLATGADYQEPARFTGRTVNDAARSFHAHQHRAHTARSVLVIGGGPSGVELSAEIRRANPGATVTLAHSGAHLLSRNGGHRLGRKAQAWLVANDIRVHLDTLVSSAGGTVNSLQDQRGNGLGADVVFWTTGTTPNTLWLRLAGLGSWLDPRGHVKVDRHLRVRGQRDVFAIGDVNDVAEAKLTPSALAQGEAAAHTIRTQMRGVKHAGLPRPYKPSPVRVFSVPLGPEAGVTMIPMLGRDGAVLGSRATAAIKSRTLMLPTVEALLGRGSH